MGASNNVIITRRLLLPYQQSMAYAKHFYRNGDYTAFQRLKCAHVLDLEESNVSPHSAYQWQ